jgi:hypothetical protein
MSGMDEPTVPIAKQLQPIVDAFSAISKQLVEVGAAMNRAMTEFWKTPSGQYLKAVVDYYDRHPEELDAMIAAREAEAAIRYCDCMCGRWKHRGICTRTASTDRAFSLDGDRVDVPLCSACAASIDEQRPVSVR